MKNITSVLILSMLLFCTGCESSKFALSGGAGVTISKSENGNTKSNAFQFSGSPGVQELQGRHSSKKIGADGLTISEKDFQGGLKKQKKQTTEPPGN